MIYVEVAIAVAWVAFVVTQVIMPAMRNTELFPMFRRESDLRREQERVAQKLRERELEAELERAKAALSARTEAEEVKERVRGIRLDNDTTAGEERQ